MYLIIKSQDWLSVGNCAKNNLFGRQCTVSKKALNNNDTATVSTAELIAPSFSLWTETPPTRTFLLLQRASLLPSRRRTPWMAVPFRWLTHRVRIIYLSDSFITSLLPSRTPTQCQREIQNKNNFIDKYSWMRLSPAYFFASPFLRDRPQFIVQKYHRLYSILRISLLLDRFQLFS